ncbi:bifunctional diaminohydroxyphosphoribosylaminopyrimidine deaminase/5-amino-6-(5-phosphoribosylamino)uracil reductase RibD [Facilibium subflavum]|uniref:bifunctional diaminohydroxyphosphoribosylaminopyrimidine deaminase/5-amino-6-(5-phosphoribosylamino)uracil reductase RibD n=1 Tax=Facilibium subflavum TaxID=2219058 RepID=UPI000E647BB3|nr:bifunctional diaminohydroxyphosphoribosylaminopyrimidine deaminase/5-amino-6-(5-phosphoribosylamino)uracil reductase RibD [Facilibium subflavum]
MLSVEHFYMQQALMLAKRGYLTVSPNPMVGCIIVKNGQIIGEGWHQYAGGDHAEIMALKQAGEKAVDATVYVTLEPCCHQGRTGACTDALIKAGVKKVVIATKDPNPCVSGLGIQILKAHQIEVVVGIEREKACTLNKIFFYFYQHKKPYVVAKWGMSVDGQLTVAKSDTKQITNALSQQSVHNLRNRLDAVIVGAKTVLDDNPLLTVRHTDADIINQPLRVVVSASGALPLDAHVFNTTVAKTILFCGEQTDENVLHRLSQKGVECIKLALNQSGRLSIQTMLVILAEKGITSILVEGGQKLHEAFFREGLVNEVHGFIAPVLINGFHQKRPLNRLDRYWVDNDVLFRGELEESYV